MNSGTLLALSGLGSLPLVELYRLLLVHPRLRLLARLRMEKKKGRGARAMSAGMSSRGVLHSAEIRAKGGGTARRDRNRLRCSAASLRHAARTLAAMLAVTDVDPCWSPVSRVLEAEAAL